MQTLTIQITNANAVRLLEDLEAMNLIRVVRAVQPKEKKQKLSEKLAGSISAKKAGQMRKELTQMRNEWERNT